MRKNALLKSRPVNMGVVALATIALWGGAVIPAHAAEVKSPIDCAPAASAKDVTDGLKIAGFTVSKGTTPEKFTGSVLGTLKDGVAPGTDMIIVEFDDKGAVGEHGLWAGMSGSPVYTPDGELIGAVAYGLGMGKQMIAGVTPAKAMYAQIKGQKKKAIVDESTSKKLAARGISVKAGAQFSQLPMMISAPGFDKLASAQQERLQDRLAERAPGLQFAGAAASGTQAKTADQPAAGLSAGSNIAVSVTTGFIDFTGIGTTTAVCGKKVMGFGHPMTFAGSDAAGILRDASAITVVDDAVLGPFKLANAGKPVGALTYDGLAAISGTVGGKTNPELTISSTVKMKGAKTRKDETQVYDSSIADMVAMFHVEYAMMLAKDSASQTNVKATYVIKGTKNGKAFKVKEKVKAPSMELSWALADALWTLASEPKVEITSVSVSIKEQ